MDGEPRPTALDPASMAPSRGLFGPADLDRMAAAYRAALMIASDESGPFALVSGDDLRASLSRAIVDEARSGVSDVDQLKAGALRALGPRPDARASG